MRQPFVREVARTRLRGPVGDETDVADTAAVVQRDSARRGAGRPWRRRSPGLMTGPAQQLDTPVARQARVYDYLLGGKDNFAADREAAEQAMAAFPGLAARARSNRAFLARAVRYLVDEAGIRQFLDVGTGPPPPDNTPDARH